MTHLTPLEDILQKVYVINATSEGISYLTATQLNDLSYENLKKLTIGLQEHDVGVRLEGRHRVAFTTIDGPTHHAYGPNGRGHTSAHEALNTIYHSLAHLEKE